MDRIHICPACEARKRGVKSRIAFVHTCGNVAEIQGRGSGKKFAEDNTRKFEDLSYQEQGDLINLYLETINNSETPVWDRR